jgi:hypothetical protein
MSYPNITSLYKYRATSDRRLESLRKNNLWVSHPNSFNDPFDCNTDNYELDRVEPETVSLLTNAGLNLDFNDESTRHNFNGVRHAKLVEKANEFGVLYLTANCESTLMWSHYSDSHRGFCMEFERAGNCKLDDLEKPRPVSYSHYCPDIDLDNSWDSIDAFRSEICKLVLVKAQEWQYEEEWRCIYRYGNRLVDYPGALKSIIWGLRTSKEDKAAIRDIFENARIMFRQAVRARGEFRLSIESEQI